MRISYHPDVAIVENGQAKHVKSEEVNINSKVTKLRNKVSQMTEVPAHETTRHEA